MMKVRYNGHSCFSIFDKDGLCIVMDPYEPGSYGGAISYHPIDSKPDIITVSHDHPDHSDVGQFEGDFEVLRDAGEAKGIKFETLQVYHDRSEGSERGPCKIFKFQVDGVTICHMADLGHVLSDEQVEWIGDVDVMMLPVGGYYTIDANEATDTVERTRPKIVIPMHYKTDKCGFDITTYEPFIEGKQNVQVLDTDEIELFSDKLPGVTEIFVLKHRL
ncbi:MBL fold metallo-hydrolase [bacterium]|nr:MBL fold metallo-hydrolase [bacterium]